VRERILDSSCGPQRRATGLANRRANSNG
jgi:hypothetical protein